MSNLTPVACALRVDSKRHEDCIPKAWYLCTKFLNKCWPAAVHKIDADGIITDLGTNENHAGIIVTDNGVRVFLRDMPPTGQQSEIGSILENASSLKPQRFWAYTTTGEKETCYAYQVITKKWTSQEKGVSKGFPTSEKPAIVYVVDFSSPTPPRQEDVTQGIRDPTRITMTDTGACVFGSNTHSTQKVYVNNVCMGNVLLPPFSSSISIKDLDMQTYEQYETKSED